MTTRQPEALRLTEIARYCFRSEGMSDPPEQFESPTGDMVDYFDHVEIEKALLARITELESQLAQRFDAADVATASAQGFRDGVASLSANAGEPRRRSCRARTEHQPEPLRLLHRDRATEERLK